MRKTNDIVSNSTSPHRPGVGPDGGLCRHVVVIDKARQPSIRQPHLRALAQQHCNVWKHSLLPTVLTCNTSGCCPGCPCAQRQKEGGVHRLYLAEGVCTIRRPQVQVEDVVAVEPLQAPSDGQRDVTPPTKLPGLCMCGAGPAKTEANVLGKMRLTSAVALQQ